uniref:Protein kinase domain-containing protein n=1 Tax=viral metagenome TaxID=1070528 RepID=A0A6C0LZ56_9ZZZZ
MGDDYHKVGDTINGYTVLDYAGHPRSRNPLYHVKDRSGGTYIMKRVEMYHLKEAVITTQNDHPNVISSHDVFAANGRIYIVLPEAKSWLTGIIEDALYEDDQRPYIKRIKSLIYQMYCGLEYLSKRGVVHLDLRPDNILLFDDTLKIIDFGISLLCVYDVCKVDDANGIIRYMAPEMYTTTSVASVNSKTDMWAAGCVMYELLAKRGLFSEDDPEPFAEEAPKVIRRVLKSNIIAKTIGAEFQKVFAMTMVADPHIRASASDVLHVLNKHGACPETNVMIDYPMLTNDANRELFIDHAYTIGGLVPQNGEVWLVALQIYDSFMSSMMHSSELSVGVLALACSDIASVLVVTYDSYDSEIFLDEAYGTIKNSKDMQSTTNPTQYILRELKPRILNTIKFKIDYPSAIVSAITTMTYDSENMLALVTCMKAVQVSGLAERVVIHTTN